MGVKGGSVSRVDECAGEWRAKKGERKRDRGERSGAEQSSSVLPAPGAPSHISPGIYEPRYDREIARMAE